MSRRNERVNFSPLETLDKNKCACWSKLCTTTSVSVAYQSDTMVQLKKSTILVSKQYFKKRKLIDDTQLRCTDWVETIWSARLWLTAVRCCCQSPGNPAAVHETTFQCPCVSVHVTSVCATVRETKIVLRQSKSTILECAHHMSAVGVLSEYQIRGCRLFCRTACDPWISQASHTACWLVATNVLMEREHAYILTALVTLLQGSAIWLKTVEKHFIEALFSTGRAANLISQAVSINCMWQMSLSWAFIFKHCLCNRKRSCWCDWLKFTKNVLNDFFFPEH